MTLTSISFDYILYLVFEIYQSEGETMWLDNICLWIGRIILISPGAFALWLILHMLWIRMFNRLVRTKHFRRYIIFHKIIDRYIRVKWLGEEAGMILGAMTETMTDVAAARKNDAE